MRVDTVTFDPVEEVGQVVSTDPVGAVEQEVMFDMLMSEARSSAVGTSSLAVEQMSLGNDFSRFYEPGSLESYPFLSPNGRTA